MNIAILIPSLVAGGAERAAATVGEYFLQQGHKVYYFLFSDNRKSFFRVEGKIVRTCIFFPFSSDWTMKENIRELYFSARTLKRLKKKYKIDISVSFMEAWNFLNVCSKYNDKVIVSVRTVISERTEYTGLLYDPKWIKKLYNKADAVVAVSDYARRDLIDNYGIKENKTVTVSNVSKQYSVSSKDETWDYGDKVVINIGRMDTVKQQERIIRAFSIVKEKVKNARLIIVGDGKQMNFLKEIAASFGLSDDVILPGTKSDVGYYLRHSRAFVLTSRVEGFPNVIVEAMAYGVPIITTDSPGGCGEIVGSHPQVNDIQLCKYGIATPYIKGNAARDETICEEEKMLAEAMVKVLTDESLYEKYSDMSKERAADYTEEKIMQKWCNVLGL